MPTTIRGRLERLWCLKFGWCLVQTIKRVGEVGAVVRSLPSDPKVPGSIHGSAESGIFGDLLSR